VNSKSFLPQESNPDFWLPVPRPGHFNDRATVNSFFGLRVAGKRKMASLSIHTSEISISLGLWEKRRNNLNEIAIIKLRAILEIVYGPQWCTNPGCLATRRLNFVQWLLIIVGSRYGACFKSPFWHLEFRDGSQIFKKHLCIPYGPPHVFHMYY